MDLVLKPETIAKIVIIITITAIISYILKRMFRNLKNLSSQHTFLKSLGEAFYHHITWVIWSIGIILASDIFIHDDHCPLPGAPFLIIKKLFFVFIFTWFFLMWKQTVEKLLIKRASKKETSITDKELITVFGKLASVLIFIVSGFMVLDTFDVPLQALLAFGGIGSLAVSWAAKDVVANFFGGMMIFINRPFAIGDWIKSPNKGFEGIVENIGWYMTQIRTFERRPTYIPNALVTDAIVENPGRMYNRRIKATIGLRYEDIKHIKKVVDAIKEMLNTHPEIDQNQLLFVNFMEFGPYSLDINVYCFTKTTKWGYYREVQQDVLLKIAQIIKDNGADIAFPTNSVYVQSSHPTAIS